MTQPRQNRPRKVFLRASLVWGDSVVAVSDVAPGRSVSTSAHGWAVPPEAGIPEVPVTGRASGWEVDASGADDGVARIGGTEQTVSTGERLRLAAVGDVAVLRFGALAFCFHVEVGRSRPPLRALVDPLLAAGGGFAAVAVLGGLTLVYAVTGRASPSKPSSLQRPDELARSYYVDASLLATIPIRSLPATPDDQDRWIPDRPFATTPVEEALLRLPPRPRGEALTPHAVSAVMLSGYPAIESCSDARPTDSVSPSGTVRVEVTIGPSGLVQDVRLLDTELGDDVAQCVGDQIRRFEFPKTGARTTTRFALRLRP